MATVQNHLNKNVDWHKVLFCESEGFYKRMDSIAKGRFSDSNVAEEAVNFALSRMQENNWQKLNQFTGKNGATPTTFLYRVFNNLLSDYRDKLYGRIRPPTWVKQKGEVWIAAFNCFYLQQLDEEQVSVKLQRFNLDIDEISEICRQIKISCKTKKSPCHLITNGNYTEDIENFSTSPFYTSEQEMIILSEQTDKFKKILAAILMLPTGNGSDNAFYRQLEALDICIEDIELLKQIYVELLSLAEISRIHNCKYHVVSRRKLKLEKQLYVLASSHINM